MKTNKTNSQLLTDDLVLCISRFLKEKEYLIISFERDVIFLLDGYLTCLNAVDTESKRLTLPSLFSDVIESFPGLEEDVSYLLSLVVMKILPNKEVKFSFVKAA